MITREQLADLQPGDVVEMTASSWPDGTVIRGPVTISGPQRHYLGPVWLDERWGDLVTLTVVSRAPRPLYINHPRTEPVAGDVVRDADGNDSVTVWLYISHEYVAPWMSSGKGYFAAEHMPARLRLLVDGETGQVVQ